MKVSITILLFLTSLTLFAQTTEYVIPGGVENESSGVLTDAINIINHKGTITIKGDIEVKGNITIPKGIELNFFKGNRLIIKDNIIITINGTINAGDFQIFDIKGNDPINGLAHMQTTPEWFGYDEAKTDIERHKSIQMAISSSRSVKFKAKDYYLEGTLIKENYNGLTIQGEGIGNTRLIFKSGVDGISFTRQSSRRDLKEGTLFVKDITIISKVHGDLAAAIRTEHAAKQPGLVFNNVEILGKWHRGIYMNNGAESSFNNVIIRGDKSKLFGIVLKSKNYTIEVNEGGETIEKEFNSAVSYTFNGVSIYGANVGMRFINETNTGIEGIKISDCDIVNAYRGIHFSNSKSEEYFSPQINILNSHINVDEINILIENATQVFIGGGTLLYNSGEANGNFIKLTNVSEFRITDTYSAAIGMGNDKDIYGVLISGNVASGVIEGVIKKKKESNTLAILLRKEAGEIQNIKIDITELN